MTFLIDQIEDTNKPEMDCTIFYLQENIFVILGRVQKMLRRSELPDRLALIQEVETRVFACDTYTGAKSICREYVRAEDDPDLEDDEEFEEDEFEDDTDEID